MPPADEPVSSPHEPPLRIVPGPEARGLLSRVPSPLTAVPAAAVKSSEMTPGASSPSLTVPPGVRQPPTFQNKIRFGSDPNQIYHAFRHTDEAGFDRARVEGAVRKDLMSRIEGLHIGLYQGSVIIGEQTIDYNAFKFASGDVNVGRITVRP